MIRKSNFIWLAAILAMVLLFSGSNQGHVKAAATDLIITGTIDGPLPGGLPKAVELYVVNSIADMSIYGIGSANNGGGTDGEEFTFPAVAATAGDFIYVATESTEFTNWFGFAPDHTDNTAPNINGDDAVELFESGIVIDVFGDIAVDGTGQPWEHLDGWAYRVDGTEAQNPFVLADWSFSGINALDGEATNATAVTPFPNGTYAPAGAADTAPDVSGSSPANAATDVVIGSDITITFTEDVNVTGSWFDITCVSSGTHTAVVSGGPASYTLNPDTDFANSENCTVTVFAAQVTDVDTDDPPDNMDADAAFSFDTESAAPPAGSDLIITGVVDATLTGGIPKAVELYAVNDIADLSIYGVGSANNGGGTDGEEFTLPADSATAGDFIYVASESTGFTSWFGFAPNYTSGAMAINGDDAVELFQNGAVVDIFGDINVDGNGQPWEYLDGWAYRVGDSGPDGSTFVLANWTFSGPNALDGESDNATAVTPFPIGSYAPPAPPLILVGVIDATLTGGIPKAVELYVGQNIADLSIYGLGSANNGGGTDGEEFTFPADSATAGDYIYVASESTAFTSWFGFAPTYTSGAMAINGDDAVELFESGAVIDVFGDINVDGNGQPWEYLDGWAYRVDGTGPDGSAFVLANWTFSGPNALDGESDNATAATPFPIGTYTFGGGGDTAPTVSSSTPANGATAVSVTSNIDITFSEDVTVTGSWFDINCAVSGTHTAAISGGPTAFTLNPDIDFSNSESCTVTVFAAQVADQDGTADNMAADHSFSFTTEIAFGVCGDPATFIHDIQGSGATSPLVGSTVVIDGVVVGDFQNNASADNGDLNGFYVQEEDSDADADATTSEGIFAFGFISEDVAVGDHVRVRGDVSEFSTSGGASLLTELSNLTVEICTTAAPMPAATNVTLPVTAIGDLESVEGMLTTFSQSLVIGEYFNFDRFGQIVLMTDRLFQPTAVFAPGSVDAANLADLNARSRITIDDGRTSQNPDPAIHPNGNVFDLTNLFRGGDIVQGATGVIDDTFGVYRLQPTQGANFTSVNPRTAAPDNVGGNVTVASFNVLNYFTTLDGSGAICGPAGNQGCRGADNADEFTRQRDKIIAALVAIDADVVGLMEIENNASASLADLVAGLNDVVGAGTYAYVDAGTIGDDVIKVGMIYQPASVTPYGASAILDSSVDVRFDDTLNRPALAQTFFENDTGGTVTVVVNHLKSKGSSCGSGDDDPEQGNCNGTRTMAAAAMVDWLATDPTGSGDADYLIIGDLNAYDKEDPISAILAGSDDTASTSDDYTDLAALFGGEFAYTYVFSGQFGYLDYALANSSLLPQITGTTVWHINADEPDILDYDTSFKQPAQDALYEANAYRASDHDPVIIGLNLDRATNSDGCYVLALNGTPFAGPATVLSIGDPGYTAGNFQAGRWGRSEGLSRMACYEIHGTDSRDVIVGGNSGDQLFGYGGNDLLIGRKGQDTFTGGTGADTMQGSQGIDTVLDYEFGIDLCLSIEIGC